MEEAIKTRLIVILSATTVLFVIFGVASCNNARGLRQSKDQEIAVRMTAEEERVRIQQEKRAMDEKCNTLVQSLEEEKAAHQASKKALVQEQLVNQSLREELAKLTKRKEALEDDVKDALVAPQKAKTAAP